MTEKTYTIHQFVDGKRHTYHGVPAKLAQDPEAFRQHILDRIASTLGLSYDEVVRRTYPVMAKVTPKMQRLLRSANRRKRKRGIRLYWAAPGEHSLHRINSEIAQGNFDRSQILIREGMRRLADSCLSFSGEISKVASVFERVTAQIAATRSGKTALMDRMREENTASNIMIIEPRKETP